MPHSHSSSASQVQTSPGSSVNGPEHGATTKPSSPSPPPSSPPPTGPTPKSGRFRRYLLYLFLTAGLGYAGGVWFSLKSDNFHDFFTEYVPFGEDAVLYLEERDFHRRFPNATRQINRRPSDGQEEGQKVVIPSNSGISWKSLEEQNQQQEQQQQQQQQEDGVDVTQRDKHMSAVEGNQAEQHPEKLHPKAEVTPVDKAVKQETKSAPKEPEPAAPAKPEPKPAMEEKREPVAPVGKVEPLSEENVADPAVKDLVHIVNGLIAVVNQGDSAKQLSAPLEKAKTDFLKLAEGIASAKSKAQADAQAELKEAHTEFDRLATELVQRVDQVRTQDAAQFREEFESEREKLVSAYQEKVNTELERANEVAEQRLRNELVEQAIELNRKFLADIKELVEREREGRLSKLSELTSDVSELEQLTADWNPVIDANLKTQQLQVAIDALRAAIENSDVPRPFLNELVAVKELASSSPVVAEAVNSITPVAYQHGVPSSAQMIDRFRRVAGEVRKASLLPEDAGITSHIASYAMSKATFKKQVSSAGDDVESVLTRTENFLEEGNLDEAAREMNSLQGWARVLSKDWLTDVRRVLEVRQALNVRILHSSSFVLFETKLVVTDFKIVRAGYGGRGSSTLPPDGVAM